MEKKNKNILSIVLLSLSLVGVVGAAAAITKGFSELPDIVLSSSEEITTHVEENTSQQEETFEIVDVSEIYGKLYLKDIYGVTSKQTIDLTSEKAGDDTILKYRTKTHDLYYDEEHDESLDLSEYKWGLEIGYVLKNGHVFKGLYGLNKNNPSFDFPETSLYGYYSDIIFSLNGIAPENGLTICSTTETEEKGKIFIMSSEEPELITSFADFYINGHNNYSSDRTNSYPSRPNYYCITNVSNELMNISVSVEERRGGFYYEPVEYNFENDINGNLIQIDNTNNKYTKMYFLLSCSEQTEVYLEELINCFRVKDKDYTAYLYVFGQQNEPEPTSEVPEDPGLYHITITNKQLGEYAVDSEVKLISSVRSGQTIPRVVQNVYFQLKAIKICDGEEIIGGIAGLDSSTRTNLSFRIAGSSIIPEEELVNEYDTVFNVMLNNSESITYEIALAIIDIENPDCFGSCFINNFEYLPNASDLIFNRELEAKSYYTIEPKNINSTQNIEFSHLYSISAVETDNPTINHQINDLPFDNRYLEKITINPNYSISLKFKDVNNSITGTVHKMSIYVNETIYDVYPNLKYLDTNKNTLLITERNDLKINSGKEYIFMFSASSNDLDYEQLIYTSKTSYGSIYVEDGNYDEDYSYFEEGDLMSFDGVYIDCNDGSYELRIEDVANSRTACWVREIHPENHNHCYCYLTMSGEEGDETFSFLSFKSIYYVQVYEAGEDW